MKMRIGIHTKTHGATTNTKTLPLDLIEHRADGSLINLELVGVYDVVTTEEGLRDLISCAKYLLACVENGEIIPGIPLTEKAVPPPPPNSIKPPGFPPPPSKHTRLDWDLVVKSFSKLMNKLNITWEN